MRIEMYARYNGKEYRASKQEDGTYNLISTDSKDLQNGFKESKKGIYKKNVEKAELESIFIVKPICELKGYNKCIFDVCETNGDKITISPRDSEISNVDDELKALGLTVKAVGKEEYETTVDMNQVEIYEEKKYIYPDKKVEMLKKSKYSKGRVKKTLDPFSKVTAKSAGMRRRVVDDNSPPISISMP